MTFHRYIETRYKVACDLQRSIELDSEMINMLRNGLQNLNIVQAWMKNYGLYQGITSKNRKAIAERYLKFVSSHKLISGVLDESQINNIFSELLTELFQTVERSWVSATSKLLWCMYPDSIVIYDSFVHRTLVTMQCLDDDLSGFKRIGGAPSIKSNDDIKYAVQHYMNYQSMVHKLKSVHSPLLQELRAKHKELYPYDIRIIDKLLWMIGDFKNSY